MADLLRLGVIGLGAMGTEFLGVAQAHPEVEVAVAADHSEQAVARIRGTYPGLAVSIVPTHVLNRSDLDAVYIASPPDTHATYAVAAMVAGMAVFCEKPLAVDLAEGARLAAVAQETGLVNALNFTFADRAAAVEAERLLRSGSLGEVVGVDMRFHFPRWPRPFQSGAKWLGSRGQGGFLREVGSHFVFLTDRLLGDVAVCSSRVSYGTAAENEEHAEITASANLIAGGVPVTLVGRVGGGPESYEWTLYGTKAALRIRGFDELLFGDDDGWHAVVVNHLPRGTEETRLTAFARSVLHGEPSGLPDFGAGLRVQRVIEGLHGERGQEPAVERATDQQPKAMGS